MHTARSSIQMIIAKYIHIQGQVQGVGFRPFVYKLAIEFQLVGWVNNTVDGVHIQVEGEEDVILNFYHKLLDNIPVLAIITDQQIKEVKTEGFEDFQIILSEGKGKPNLLLTPDYGICEDCKAELHNPTDFRYRYPFITCTNCGPRYSIIQSLPYDRDKTTMDPFKMCPECQEEYDNPLHRRFYSQTNSCAKCGVELSVLGSKHSSTQEEILRLIKDSLKEGKILAVKGLGGYLIIADATDKEAIKRLRKRKNRPNKPFALMYKDLAQVKLDVEIDHKEEESLQSVFSPILLLCKKKKLKSGIAINEIAPALNEIGIMLPYTPLFDLILNDFEKPIIATSGNISNSPIIYEDTKAKDYLSSIADLIITYNREIVIPQDDSVIRFTAKHKKKIIIRRSRSFAPGYHNKQRDLIPAKSILTMGADLKNSFCFYHQQNTYLSQYLGNLESYETQEAYDKVLQHFLNIFQAKPQLIITDLHPQYYTSQKAEEIAKNWKLDILKVQHHKAHFASVLAENQLLQTSEVILGVIWDGVGWGDDEEIWGGEFFDYRHNGEDLSQNIQRLAHFEYFSYFTMDKFAREPRLPLYSLTYDHPLFEKYVKPKFTPIELNIYPKIIARETTKKTSSMGRIFDAAASLLGLGDKISFEGEAAMKLEAMATNYYRENECLEYYSAFTSTSKPSAKKLLYQIMDDLEDGVSKEKIAFKFHLSLIKIIEEIAKTQHYRKIAMSGGVFQNALLVDIAIDILGEDFELFYQQDLSPNDEGIAFGQLWFHKHK